MAVLDLSNHDYSTFDPDCLKAAGVSHIIVGCWDLSVTLDIVRRARAAAIVADELYCFLYPGLPWEQREVDNAIEVQRQLGGIVLAWPDCESQFTEWPGDLDTEAAGMTVEGRLAVLRLARAKLAAAGMALGTYTGESYWRDKYGNSTEFSKDPLWLASYGANDPANPRPPITYVDFGGWKLVFRHQYSSTITVCGRNRDHNYELVEVDDMTPAEVEEIVRKVVDESSGAYFRDLMKKYWLDGLTGDFSDPADPEVVAAIRAAVVTVPAAFPLNPEDIAKAFDDAAARIRHAANVRSK
jgi:hypothetical protein